MPQNYKILSTHGNIAHDHTEFICKTESDLPTSNITFGDIAIIIETCDVYFFDGRQWVKE